jgi:hypothetical protein
LLVVCFSTARSTAASVIPRPSSVTRIPSVPPASTTTRTREASASRLFSTSSFTAEAGRSTTSPAAMRSIVAWSSR